jgi:hypothetical protein
MLYDAGGVSGDVVVSGDIATSSLVTANPMASVRLGVTVNTDAGEHAVEMMVDGKSTMLLLVPILLLCLLYRNRWRAAAQYPATLSLLPSSVLRLAGTLFCCIPRCCDALQSRSRRLGPANIIDTVRRYDRCMHWAQESLTSDAARTKSYPSHDAAHASSFCFTSREIAFYASLLREKARFHMLAAVAFTRG